MAKAKTIEQILKSKETGSTAQVRARQRIEIQIAHRVVKDALAAGYAIGIDNGGDDEEYKGSNELEIMDAMFSTDEERLHFYDKTTPTQSSLNRPKGFVFFVYGNSGWDVISDYSVNMEGLLAGANALATELEK